MAPISNCVHSYRPFRFRNNHRLLALPPHKMRRFNSAQSWRLIPTATLCIVNFSITAFSQQIVPPPSFPVGPRPSNQTSETSNPGGQSPTQSATPHPEARPIPSPGTNDLNEENLLGAELGLGDRCPLDFDSDNPDIIGQRMKRGRA
jgi:hypothetical protein